MHAMVRASRPGRGRPPLPGPRYACGRRKPEGDPRGTQVWQFLRQQGWHFGLNEKYKTEVARLSYGGHLTDRQVDTCHEIGRIYGQFERLHRKPRSAASPSYMQGIAGSGLEDDLLDPDRPMEGEQSQQRDRFLNYIKRVEETMAALQERLGAFPKYVACRIEDLCVEDKSILMVDLDEICRALDYIGHRVGPQISAQPRRSTPQVPFPRHSAATSPRNQSPRRRSDEPMRKAWVDMERLRDPSLDDTKLDAKWLEMQARADRERFNQSKKKLRP